MRSKNKLSLPKQIFLFPLKTIFLQAAYQAYTAVTCYKIDFCLQVSSQKALKDEV